MKKILVGLFVVVVLGVGGYLWWSHRTPVKTEEIHFHAGFLVYVDGKKQDFSGTKYMDLEPCSVPGVKHKEDDQQEKAHLHDGVGDIVHVHRQGALWKDLFQNIRFDFPAGKPIVGYVNGSSTPDILMTPITSYESVIIVAGDGKGVDTSAYVTKDHIREVEQKSETCGS